MSLSFRNARLRAKHILAFSTMALIVAVTGIFGIWRVDSVVTQVKTMLRGRALQEKAVLNMQLSQKACRVNLVEAAMVRTDPDEFEEHVNNYRAKNELFKKYSNALLNGDPALGIPPAPAGSPVANYAAAVLASWGEFEKAADQLIAHKQRLLKGLRSGVVDQAAKDALADETLNRLALETIRDTSENAKLDIDDLADYLESQTYAGLKATDTIRQSTRYTFITVIIMAVAAAIGLGLLFTRMIVGRVKRVAAALQSGARGDLTAAVPVDSRDELGTLGDDFNTMADRLSGMLTSVRKAVGELHALSDKIAVAAGKVTEGEEIQAKGVNAASSAISEINASIREVADGVANLSLSAADTSSSILEMTASVEEVAINADSLSRLVDEVSSSVIQMAASIKQIDGSVQSLMEISTTTASSVAQMDTAIGQVEVNARETAALSEDVEREAERGKRAVEDAIAGIVAIQRSSRITTEVIDVLSRKVEDIGGIISVIDEIAEQTNLLSLNAAIIAAQAGEHGRGFAVVAGEITDLSDRTRTSTREIAEVIMGVQSETRRAVEAISRADKSIADEERLSANADEALGKIVMRAREASSRVAEIARATVEQATGSKIIRDAINRVTDMTGQIASATSEQGAGGDLIMTAVERMRDATAQVRNSTREQSATGNIIARSTENITDMIGQFRNASEEQFRGSEQIVRSMEEIQKSATMSLEVSRVMEEAAITLSRQVKVLETEMEGFHIRGQSSSR